MTCKTLNLESYIIVVETHPDTIVDLRLDHPFPELVSHVNTLDLTQMDRMTLGHVPFGVILLKAVQDWRSEVRVSKKTVLKKEL